MEASMTFDGRTVVVTGSARGIGQSVAKSYADHGANVVLADLNDDGQRNADAIRQRGGRALFVHSDLRQEGDVIGLMNQAVAQFGAIDVLINNAGFTRFKSPYELTVAEWDDVLNTHLRGMFLCAREAAKAMREGNRGGAIVNIASTRALMSEPGAEAYAAAKGGIVALTHALAISLGPDRIRVNCVSPGWIRTSSYETLREVDHRQHPAGRVGKPEDIALACLYLTDPANDFVTGVNLVVDGGMTRKMVYEE
jgi:NAD(P)-dependent dehydrogenase (short-subunit alcohol dehydrogenase family)